jgi:hypothetical protein
MTPNYVPPELVPDVWPLFVDGLQAVQATDSTVEWTLPSVRDALVHEKAFAVICTAGDTQAGFFIGYPQPDKAFFIWIAHLERGHDLAEGIGHVKDFAKKLGCNRLIFGTNRRGWDRVARKHGFRPSYWEQSI